MISRSLLLSLALLFCTADLAAQDIPDPAVRYDADYPAPEFHRERRAAVMERLPDDAVAVFFSAPERRRQHNTHHRYRQDSDLYYLTGTTEPRSEEHTSELQSRGHLVCRLLLEKKNRAR